MDAEQLRRFRRAESANGFFSFRWEGVTVVGKKLRGKTGSVLLHKRLQFRQRIGVFRRIACHRQPRFSAQNRVICASYPVDAILGQLARPCAERAGDDGRAIWC